MREDTYTRDEAGARDHAAALGASEHIGGSDDDSPGYDESRLCSRCENGHGGHVCAWCAGAERRAG
jgi:hypothetical protein